MQRIRFEPILLAPVFLLLWSGLVGAQYHDARYVLGYVPTGAQNGCVSLFDATRTPPVLTTLARVQDHASVTMDADNAHILVTARGLAFPSTLMQHGIFRLNPTTGRYSTIFAVPISRRPVLQFLRSTVDQDGNYLTIVEEAGGATETQIWKIAPGGAATTLVGRGVLGSYGYYNARLARDIDTGHYLIHSLWGAVPPLPGTSYRVFEVDGQQGTVSTWHLGAPAPVIYMSLYYNSLPQNYRNGHLEGVVDTWVVRMTKGSIPFTTLGSVNTSVLVGDRAFDLQSAPRPLTVSFASLANSVPPTMTFADTRLLTTSTIPISPRLWKARSFDFYRGRHTVSYLVGNRTWNVDFSAPNHPGKAYGVVIGASGVRPGVLLADGRRLNLNIDALAMLTASNAIAPLWRPGPGFLDAKGRATAVLNLSRIRALGIPIWIAWAVLDPAAPLSIALIPDTYVMRI